MIPLTWDSYAMLGPEQYDRVCLQMSASPTSLGRRETGSCTPSLTLREEHWHKWPEKINCSPQFKLSKKLPLKQLLTSKQPLENETLPKYLTAVQSGPSLSLWSVGYGKFNLWKQRIAVNALVQNSHVWPSEMVLLPQPPHPPELNKHRLLHDASATKNTLRGIWLIVFNIKLLIEQAAQTLKSNN